MNGNDISSQVFEISCSLGAHGNIGIDALIFKIQSSICTIQSSTITSYLKQNECSLPKNYMITSAP